MRKPLYLFVSFTTLLASCGSINDVKVSTDEVFNMMGSPTVEGMDSTMLRMAQEAEKQGHYSQAAQTYKQMLDTAPANISYRIAYAENLRKAGQLEAALSIYQSVLSSQPNNVDALEGKGLSLLAMADTDSASQVLTQTMQLAPNRWRTLNAIGVLFSTKGMYPEAQLYFDEALKFEPNHPAILNNKGLVYTLASQYPHALETLFMASKNARLPIHQIQADLNTALVYAIAGDTKQAQVMAARHLQGAALQNNLGLYALLAQDPELAKTHLHMALSESKTFYEKAWNNLAIIESPNASPSNANAKHVTIGGEVDAPSSNLPMPPASGYSTSLSPSH